MNRTLDIEKVEKELGIKLPDFFIDFHRQQAQLLEELRNVSNDFDYITISSDADWMIEHNRDFLKLPNEAGLCRNKICIGTDGCGNDSFISLLGNDKRVFFIDHEIAGELIDEEINDFKWEDEEMTRYESLEEYVKFYMIFIEVYKDEGFV